MISLCGCEIQPDQIAKQCGVDQAQLDAAFDAVGDMAVGQSRKVGECTVKRVAGSKRVVVLIAKDRGIFR
jgi:hypothetical protein